MSHATKDLSVGPADEGTNEDERDSKSCACESVPTIARASDTEEEDETDAGAIVEENEDDDDDGMLELGFMFEGGQPTRRERFQWEVPDGLRSIEVTLDIADDDPGAVQSGHYLWPAAHLLANYLVQHYCPGSDNSRILGNDSSSLPQPIVVVELGAGCALCSCVAWQLWANTLQCLVITDHDPGTLERARNNHETTLETLLDKDFMSEDDFNSTINNLGSIPTNFESLEWGNVKEMVQVQAIMAEHSVPSQRHADYILGSDLIYDVAVVEPLFRTAHQFLQSGKGRFLLSQSFAYEKATEDEIQRCCRQLGFNRTTLVEEQDGKHKIQEFYLTTTS